MTPDERRAVAYGLLVTAAFVVVDLAIGRSAAISGSYALGAIVAGVLAGLRPAVVVGVAAFVLSAASGWWNDDWGTTAYFARLSVAGAGTFLAAGAGQLRDDVVDQLGRQALLAALAELPGSSATLEETVANVLDLLVPRYAAFAAIEAGLAGEQIRVAGRGTEPVDASDALETPLRARGREIGALLTNRGRGGVQDPQFVRVLAGRVALALDNAGLSQELLTVEQQLQAILENLGEAVTVQDPSGRLVFANPAAADLLGAASVDQLLRSPPLDLFHRFTSVTESGQPLEPEMLPGRAVLAGREAPPLTLRVRDSLTGEERWRVTKSTAVHGPGGEVTLAVNVIEDITDAKRAELAQRLLADASAVLASSLDYQHTLQKVAELAVPGLADWCSVSVPRGELLEQVAVAHSDPKMLEFAAAYGARWPTRLEDPTGGAEVLRSGEPQLIALVTEAMFEAAPLPPEQLAELRKLDITSVIVVPMVTADRVVGVLSLVTAESARRFDEDDLELARELGRRAATAIENARLYTELERVAATLQRNLLPPMLPDVPGWRFNSLYMPAGEVGGDFYDVFETSAGWMTVMGDVVGRGPAAASLTAMGRYTLRTAGVLDGSPTTGLARLNDNLRERGDMALCTAAVVLLEQGGTRATLVCAGHPLPYRVRAGQVTAIGRTGPLLGAFEHVDWQPAAVGLEPGDLLVLFTDGVTDARAAAGDRFGTARLEAALSGATSADEAVAQIKAALDAFAGDLSDDDTAILAMQKL